jgi:hypothetical protein
MFMWPSTPHHALIEIIALANMRILHVLVGVLWGGQQTQKRMLHKWFHGTLAVQVIPFGNIYFQKCKSVGPCTLSTVNIFNVTPYIDYQ